MIRRSIAPTFVATICTGLLACTATADFLGGREKCWSDEDFHLAALFDGRLELSATSGGGTLHTTDGTDFDVEFPFMAVRSDAGNVVLVDNGATVAANGDTVTVFGGMDEEGTFLVCSIEERHAA